MVTNSESSEAKTILENVQFGVFRSEGTISEGTILCHMEQILIWENKLMMFLQPWRTKIDIFGRRRRKFV